MDSDHDTPETTTNAATTRRGVLRAATAGFALAASGLLLPEQAAARKRGRPGNRPHGRPDGPPRSGIFIKNIAVNFISLSLDLTVWVVAGGNAHKYDRYNLPPRPEEFRKDEGWVVVEQGTDSRGRPIGYGVYINNPYFEEVWFKTQRRVVIEPLAFGTFGVFGGTPDVPKTFVTEDGELYSFDTGGGVTATLRRRRDTRTKNFEMAIRPR